MSEEEYSGTEREVEEEEIIGPTGWVKCPVCSEIVSAKGKFVHFRHKHPDLNYMDYKDKFAPAPPPARAKASREGPIYKGETDANEILEEILDRHPDIPEKVKNEVMDWARLKGFLQPMEVQAILQSMKGVSAVTANIIASKYSFALMKAQSEGRLMVPMMIVPQPQQIQTPLITPSQQTLPQTPVSQIQIQPPIQVQPPQPQVIQQPYQPQPYQPLLPPQIPTEDRVRQIIRDEIERIRSMLAPQPQEKREEAYIEIEEPVRDSDGKIIVGPDDKPITRKMRVPASQADKFKPAEDAEEKLLNKIKLYQEIFGLGKQQLTLEDIRRIVREEVPKAPMPEEKITKEEIAKIVSEITSKQMQEFMAAHVKAEEEEKKWKSLTNALERVVNEIRSIRSTEGYQDDAMRLLGQGLSEIASTIRERKPIEIIVKEFPKFLIGQQQPPPEITGKVGEPKIIDLLPKELVE